MLSATPDFVNEETGARQSYVIAQVQWLEGGQIIEKSAGGRLRRQIRTKELQRT